MPQEMDEFTLTAYALGELDDIEQASERAELEARLVGDALMRRHVEEIRATAQWLSAELAAEATPGLTEIQHAAIERRLEQANQGNDGPVSLPLRPVRRNWAFWGSLAASVVIVCTVMASVLPKLYHLGAVSHGDGSSALPAPATGAAPFIVDSPEAPSVASRDLTKPLVREEAYAPSDAGGFPQAAPPVAQGENGFVRVADSPVSGVPSVSGFPNNANTLASIAQSLNSHQLPPVDALRTDEIINALPYHYAVPTSDDAISASIEVAGCPWDTAHRLLRVGLRTADAIPATRPSTMPSAADGGIAGFRAQIEFNPVMAGAYRLIGYETGPGAGNFRDGSTDARSMGSIGASRSVTVLYEVIPAGTIGPAAPLPLPPLKYQKLTPVAEASKELATVSIRYREAAAAPPRFREIAVTDEGRAFAAASEDFRTAAAAGAFGLALRNSPYKGAATFDLVLSTLPPPAGSEAASERASLIEMTKLAKSIANSER